MVLNYRISVVGCECTAKLLFVLAFHLSESDDPPINPVRISFNHNNALNVLFNKGITVATYYNRDLFETLHLAL